MKVSLNLVRHINKKYGSAGEPAPKGVDALVEKIGAQLGAVEAVVDLGKRYKGIVVAKVVSCDKHPAADKLSVCLVDDGGVTKGVKRNKEKLIEVVCGAPNTKAGQLVAYMPPGTTVPSTVDKDPLKLEAREIRGVLSHGMIASAKELRIGDDHKGILVLDEVAKPGTQISKVLPLDDVIIDIENKMFTHRPDLFGMLGIAREIAGIQHQPFKSPDWYKEDISLPKPAGTRLKLAVKNDIPKLVPRFSAVAMSNIKVGPSPLWLQVRLSALGVRPINNIVDITNFLMLETAQPLHAYDYDKLQTGTLGVRLSKKGEALRLLGGKTIKLEQGLVVITDGGRPIGLGGVMGGTGTEVDGSTKNIILESASFDMVAIRQTAMTYGLFTDAATRFTKGQSPRQTLSALVAAAGDIKRLAGGQVAGQVIDDFKPPAGRQKPKALQVTSSFINDRLGLELKTPKIRTLLENVEFKTSPLAGQDKLVVAAPFWRTDIEIPEDIVEEIGRLYGYDHLPLVLPKRDLTPPKIDRLLELKSNLRSALAAAGANEVLTYSFVDDSLIARAGQDAKQAYHIRNALSPHLQYYRLSLVPSLLEKIHPNIKQGFDEFVLFEIGRAHVRGVLDSEKLPAELERLGLVMAAKDSPKAATAFYSAKKYTDYLLNKLSISGADYRPAVEVAKLPTEWRPAMAAFEPVRSALIYVGETLVGVVGEPSQSLRANLKLPEYAVQAELDTNALVQLSRPRQYQPLNRFPPLGQDLTLKVSATLPFVEITNWLANLLADQVEAHGYQADLVPLDIFQKEADKKHQQISWRIVLAHPGKTLTTEAANKLLDYLTNMAKKQFGAERI